MDHGHGHFRTWTQIQNQNQFLKKEFLLLQKISYGLYFGTFITFPEWWLSIQIFCTVSQPLADKSAKLQFSAIGVSHCKKPAGYSSSALFSRVLSFKRGSRLKSYFRSRLWAAATLRCRLCKIMWVCCCLSGFRFAQKLPVYSSQ